MISHYILAAAGWLLVVAFVFGGFERDSILSDGHQASAITGFISQAFHDAQGMFGGFERRILLRLWCEPVMRCPVLIIESDDWGPGPPEDAEALQHLIEVLSRHRDGQGRRVVMTLGMLLSVPDGQEIRRTEEQEYYAALLSEPRFASILAAIQRGVE